MQSCAHWPYLCTKQLHPFLLWHRKGMLIKHVWLIISWRCLEFVAHEHKTSSREHYGAAQPRWRDVWSNQMLVFFPLIGFKPQNVEVAMTVILYSSRHWGKYHLSSTHVPVFLRWPASFSQSRFSIFWLVIIRKAQPIPSAQVDH